VEINGQVYPRTHYPSAVRVSPLEWLALAVVVGGLLGCIAAMAYGLVAFVVFLVELVRELV
jgi:hypothetical protein